MGNLRTIFWLMVSALALASCVDVRLQPEADKPKSGLLVLKGATIYAQPDQAPLENGVIVLEGRQISALGNSEEIEIPNGARVIELQGKTVLPGFWNSHVHFIGPEWDSAESMPAEALDQLLTERFLQYGFIHVFDTGALEPEPVLHLRKRTDSGELDGPVIRTALVPLVPPNGTPRYVEPVQLPEIANAQQARKAVDDRLARGADGIKLFTVPITRNQPFPEMDPGAVQAVTRRAHMDGRPVFAHPTNLRGVEIALEGGVDVLAHTVPAAGELPAAIYAQLREQDVALIPTLTLWEEEFGPDKTGLDEFMAAAQAQLREYWRLGGRILFGTDAGFMPVYDPLREYELMEEAGLDFTAVLTSLTTAPARQFGAGHRTGRLEAGFDADIVVVSGNPREDMKALREVELVIKQGRVLFDLL
ncbi:MAG TPA: amidohydrolase family protein [Wenzhouxiangella sp.]|nr:amidohydrolase family protein [Wenzhouxiangella sp.]